MVVIINIIHNLQPLELASVASVPWAAWGGGGPASVEGAHSLESTRGSGAGLGSGTGRGAHGVVEGDITLHQLLLWVSDSVP